jgi:hypothetical protein
MLRAAIAEIIRDHFGSWNSYKFIMIQLRLSLQSFKPIQINSIQFNSIPTHHSIKMTYVKDSPAGFTNAIERVAIVGVRKPAPNSSPQPKNIAE